MFLYVFLLLREQSGCFHGRVYCVSVYKVIRATTAMIPPSARLLAGTFESCSPAAATTSPACAYARRLEVCRVHAVSFVFGKLFFLC